MDELVNLWMAALAQGRLIRYLNCAQATLGTMAGYLGLRDRTAVRAVYPLEGGAVGGGSTCGVVSGGCMAIAVAHLARRLEGDAKAVEALYERMRSYAGWFEERHGTTLCRERCGADLGLAGGFASFLLTGKVFTRCTRHLGEAVVVLIDMVNRPLEVREGEDEEESSAGEAGGLCAAAVMRRIREQTGWGNLFLEEISISLDGGVGLSGGLCGALAGALLPLGLALGIDPAGEGPARTLYAFARGHLNLYTGRREEEIWALSSALVRDFRREFGFLECRDLAGRSFQGRDDLASFVASSARCAEVKDWCVKRATGILVRSPAC